MNVLQSYWETQTPWFIKVILMALLSILVVGCATPQEVQVVVVTTEPQVIIQEVEVTAVPDPTEEPTDEPEPTLEPTEEPTAVPTEVPTEEPEPPTEEPVAADEGMTELAAMQLACDDFAGPNKADGNTVGVRFINVSGGAVDMKYRFYSDPAGEFRDWFALGNEESHDDGANDPENEFLFTYADGTQHSLVLGDTERQCVLFGEEGVVAFSIPITPDGAGSFVLAPTRINIADQPMVQLSDTSGYYKLTSMFVEGDNKCLESGPGRDTNAVLTGASFMDDCQNVTGQFWKITPSGDAGYYFMTSEFKENELRLEGGDGQNAPAYLDSPQNVTGQFWKITESTQEGYYFLTSMFMEGENKCLESGSGPDDSHNLGGAASMAPCQNVTGQLWRLTPAGQVADSSSSSDSGDNTQAAAPTNTPETAAAAPTNTPEPVAPTNTPVPAAVSNGTGGQVWDSVTYCSDFGPIPADRTGDSRLRIVNLTSNAIPVAITNADDDSVTDRVVEPNALNQMWNTFEGKTGKFDLPSGPYTHSARNGDCILITEEGVTVVPSGVTATIETKSQPVADACGKMFSTGRTDRPVTVGLVNLTGAPIDLAVQSVTDGQIGSPRPLGPVSDFPVGAHWRTLDGYKAEATLASGKYTATASEGNCIVFQNDGAITTLTTTSAQAPTDEQLCVDLQAPAAGFSVMTRFNNLTSSPIAAEWKGNGSGSFTNSYEIEAYRANWQFDVNSGDVVKLNLPSGPFEYTVGSSNG
ncbi:MAG: hypothetical protein AAGD96_19315, partial [Chloroflexota bacterium]